MIEFEDGYGYCLCGREGELEGSCDVHTGGPGEPRRLVEAWECSACGAKWDEIWHYAGQDAA